jgi:hypothetical protein
MDKKFPQILAVAIAISALAYVFYIKPETTSSVLPSVSDSNVSETDSNLASAEIACPDSRRITAFDFTINCHGSFSLDEQGLSLFISEVGPSDIQVWKPTATSYASTADWLAARPKNDNSANTPGVHFLKYVSAPAGNFVVYNNYVQVDSDEESRPIYGPERSATLVKNGKIYIIESRFGEANASRDKEFDDFVGSFTLN